MQRPDLRIHLVIASALRGEPVRVFGDGGQVCDFTYVDNDVEVTAGSAGSVSRLHENLADTAGYPVAVQRLAAQPGDVHRTGGSTDRAHAVLSWKPGTSHEAGLRAQLDWHRATAPR